MLSFLKTVFDFSFA